ncbi:uncharacterized protein [Maniola hyperantus]|uniref:uncharacterized protein n=1 Tax=Aphantopus hyperantus TaxID=2795564 RepID=UPI001569E1B4|nr:uncharacterized protein LOC117985238 [Maniola hyperantus]
MVLWTFVAYILVFTVIENVISTEEEQEMTEIPLSRSLGFQKTLDDARVGEEYMALYNEMLKASQDTAGQFGDDDVGFSTDLTRLKGISDRRRSSRMSSPVKSRRARSQALRREKLNSQSLRSHMEHSRHSSLEQSVVY